MFLFIFHSLRSRHLEVMGARRNKSFLNSQNRLCVWGEGDSLLSVSLSSHQKKMQTIVYRESQIWEIKEDIYTKSLTKNQVYTLFHMQDIRKNVLRKFIKLCMETPCWFPLRGTYMATGNQQKHLFFSFATNA